MIQSSLWIRFSNKPFALPALFILATITLLAVFGGWLAPFDPTQTHDHFLLLPPFWDERGVVSFLLGTDDLGRDMLSRLIHGARLTMGSATIAVAMAGLGGWILASVLMFMPHELSAPINRFMDTLLALPSMLLAVLFSIAFGTSISTAILAVAMALLPHFYRVTYRALRSEYKREYVSAARLDGANTATLYFQTLLPNIAVPLVVQLTIAFSTAILDIAALGFLGLAATGAAPEWGNILSSAHDFIQVAPWTVALPGVAILVTVLCVNVVGGALRECIDPKGSTR